MNDLIEKLKKNEKPFGLLSKEEQGCLRSIGGQNKYIEMYYITGTWEGICHPCFDINISYRISPSYQPKPKVIRCEIVSPLHLSSDRWLFYYKGEWRVLHEALDFKEFIGYEHVDGSVSSFVRLRNLKEYQVATTPIAVLFEEK